jgi:flagellar hook-associated protein 1 FlgK
MLGLNLTLDTAKQTLLNTEVQIQTASNNISNAANTGYAKETAVVQSNPDLYTPAGWLGTGATVTNITQSRDQFVEQELRDATSNASQYSNLTTELGSIQTAFNDDGSTGISQALGAFWDSWDQLVQNPSELSNQTSVYQAAQGLASTIQATSQRLTTIATNDIPNQLQDTVNQANTLINQIANLNTAIANNSSVGSQPNALIDQRYQALSSLSSLIPVSYSQNASGVVTVTTTDASGPLTIVQGGTATPISTASTITGGQFGGLTQSLTDLNGYINRLNDFAGTLITQVNQIHTQDGGQAVFSGTDAATITASTDFLQGQTTANETTIASQMSSLQDSTITFTDGKQSTFSQYLSDIMNQVGTDSQQAQTDQTFNTSLQTQLQTQQQAVSGVSIDEETVNLIQFQQVYQAAAKVVDVTNQMLNSLMAVIQ